VSRLATPNSKLTTLLVGAALVKVFMSMVCLLSLCKTWTIVCCNVWVEE